LAALVSEDLRTRILDSYTVGGVNWLIYNPHLTRNLERAVAVGEYLQVPPAERQGTVGVLARAYQMAGQPDNALRIATAVVEAWGSPGNPDVQMQVHLLEDFTWLLRQHGQADRALEEIDRWLFESPGVVRHDDRGAALRLLIERSRIHAALGAWDEAEQDIDRFLEQFMALPADRRNSAAYSSACLVKGFLCEHRGDADGARAAWRDGVLQPWRQDMPATMLGQHESNLGGSQILHYLIMGSLADQLGDADIERLTARLLATIADDSSAGPASNLIKYYFSIYSPSQLRKLFRDMWRTPRGGDCARRIALRQVTFAEYVLLPVLLAAAEFIHQGALPGELSPQHDALIWDALQEGAEAYFSGTIGIQRLPQLGLAWLGTTNLLGWGGVAPALEPGLRSKAGYLLGHRYLRLGKRAEAVKLFRQALQEAAADSLVARLAGESLREAE
jgi:tetratricopeptide (TPR) repeat protein